MSKHSFELIVCIVNAGFSQNVMEAARAAGAPITTEPKEIVIGSEPPMPARIAFFTGPAGESVELFDEH